MRGIGVSKETTLQEAHKHSASHRDEVIKSEKCGCFYCEKVFPSTDIREWIDEDDGGIGQTALCPECGVDSVLGDKLISQDIEDHCAFHPKIHLKSCFRTYVPLARRSVGKMLGSMFTPPAL